MATYPQEWERHLVLADGSAIFVRPVRPEDESLYGPFVAAVSAEDARLRFLGPMRDFSHAVLARFTQLDYVRAMAFIALDERTGEMLAIARLHTIADDEKTGEYAIIVRSDMKGHGLGWLLMQLIIEYARSKNYQTVLGRVLHENMAMLRMCRELGFHIAMDPDEPPVSIVTLAL
jgi:RimJ/RimL family protein N-acetyltransferase